MGGCTTLPTEYREPPQLSQQEREQHHRRVFERAVDLIEKHYFDAKFRGLDLEALRDKYRGRAIAAVDTDALYRVLNELCAEFKESHLGALSPRRAHENRTDHRAAVGLRWQLAENKRVVMEVVPGGPAERAGVQPGWLIVSRNGKPLDETQPFVTRLGEPVRFGFLDHDDVPREIALEPQLLNFDRLESRPLRDGFRYLRFDRFNLAALRWLSAELKAHPDAPGVVLDLRQNSGGTTFILRMAVAEFFDRSVGVGTFVRRSGSQTEAGDFQWRAAQYPGKLVVLTDNASGSAAEILAHAVQFHQRGTVVGRNTAGAVILSRMYGLPGGGRLQIPVQDYIGLDGKRLEGRGVVPDVEVPRATLAQLRALEDPDVAKAVEILAK
jgi:carboxyl-terminal processing protease